MKYKRISFIIKNDYDYTIQTIFKNIELEKFNINNVSSEIYLNNDMTNNTYNLYKEDEIFKIFNSNNKYQVLELIMILKNNNNEIYIQIYDSYNCDIVLNEELFERIYNNIKNYDNFYNIIIDYSEEEIMNIRNYINSLSI